MRTAKNFVVAKKSKTLVRLEYAVVRGVLGILGFLPRSLALTVATTLTSVAYFLLPGLRRVAEVNLSIAFPEKNAAERRRLAKGAFRNLGRILGEMSQFPKATPESLSKLIEFQIDPVLYEEYRKLKQMGRGVIIVSPHLGNWEVLVFGWATYDSPMSYLARPLDNPLIEGLTVDLRTKFGNRPINKTNSVMIAARVLREEGLLGILADVNAHPKEGVFVPFFGVEACTSSGPALLAMRTDSAILPIAGVWDEEKQHYIGVHGKLIYAAKTGDRQADVKTTTAEFTAEIEKLVRRFPDQWLWIHKRWKTRPRGEAEIY